MGWIGRSIGRQLGLLIAAGIVGLVGFHWWGARATDQLVLAKYDRLLESKDLVADVLPPPMYVLEAYATALDVARANDVPAIDAAAEVLGRLEREFRDRVGFWTAHLPDGEIRRQVAGPVVATADAFFATITTELMPAVRRGDRTLIEAAATALRTRYQAHRLAIDAIVTTSTAQQVALAAAQRGGLRTYDREKLAALIGLVVLLIAIGARVRASIVGPLHEMQAALAGLRAGDLGQRVTAHRQDELGAMAASFNAALDEIERSMTSVRRVSDGLGTAAGDLAEVAHRTSDGAQRQASEFVKIWAL